MELKFQTDQNKFQLLLKMTNIFRASYSVLSIWASGDYQRAVESYFKLKEYTSPQMEAGKRMHEEWKAEVDKTKCLPKIFGGKKLSNPQTELKIERKLDDWLELVGVIDVYDNQTIIDYKTGVKSSEAYASDFQKNVYQILKPKATRAEFYRFDQYQNEVDVSVVHLTDKTLKDGLNWVLTLASDMHHYLTKNDLYQQLGDEVE